MSPQTPISVLLGRALGLFGRRLPLYVSVTVAAIAAEALVVLVWRPPQSILFAACIFMPLQSAVIYAFVAADSYAEQASVSRTWARALERSWAVVVIDFVGTAILLWGVASTAQGDPLAHVREIFAIVLAVMLVFAEAAAVVEDEDTNEGGLKRTALLVPRSILRSVSLVLLGGFVIRALFLFGLQIGTELLAIALGVALLRWNVGNVEFWTVCAIPTLVNAPLAVATMVFYVDAGDFESSLGGDADDDVAVK